MSAFPRTPSQWDTYLASLAPLDLYAKAALANSVGFVKTLKHEGNSAADIEQILRLLAQRLRQHGVGYPPGFYDFAKLSV